MSDGMFLLLAAGALTLFVLVVLASPPADRNPHTDARKSKWNTRRPK
jgi:hypothetical protein